MIRLTISREKYDQFMRDGAVVIDRPTVRRKAGPLAITNPTGDFTLGCGIKIGQERELKWRDEPRQNEKIGQIRGGIAAVAVAVEYDKDSGWWDVTFARHIVEGQIFHLAPKAGYTLNALASADPEAAAPYSEEVEKKALEEQVARRDAFKTSVAKLQEVAEELPMDPETRRHTERIKRAIAEALAA